MSSRLRPGCKCGRRAGCSNHPAPRPHSLRTAWRPGTGRRRPSQAASATGSGLGSATAFLSLRARGCAPFPASARGDRYLWATGGLEGRVGAENTLRTLLSHLHNLPGPKRRAGLGEPGTPEGLQIGRKPGGRPLTRAAGTFQDPIRGVPERSRLGSLSQLLNNPCRRPRGIFWVVPLSIPSPFGDSASTNVEGKRLGPFSARCAAWWDGGE